ncbi:MAG: SprT-like domain-containing protein [Bacteroidales bacterium]|nr:SprT-like domain-containing protein [Bacteroidales bacterium]
MKATIPYIEKLFEEFNQQMFAGQLPIIPIELSDAKTFLGVCAYKKRQTDDGKTEYYDFKLRINTRIDLPEHEIEDTIIHEMIHYFIGVKQLEDVSSHGPVFLHIMNSINEKYGRHITVSHKSTEEQREQAVDKKAHWHVIALVNFKDGNTGIKVLPRVLPRILGFYNAVIADRRVNSIDLYMSNNPFFNRFPNSAALSIQFIDKDEAARNLIGAEHMGCDGKKILREK